MAPGHDNRPIPIKMHRGHRSLVPFKRLHTLSAKNIPNLDRLIERPRHNQVGLTVEIHAKDEVLMAVEGPDAVEGFGFEVPDAEGAVVGGGGDVAGVGGPERGRRRRRSGRRGRLWGLRWGQRRRRRLGFCRGRRSEKAAVSGELDAGDGAGVVAESGGGGR
ncbi:uncharacterized protein A4U43_C07F37170 [Asparagus officinalis]|uniref:Uncharacterized protein n=1 Tax=Asparagus officinalis TaxID=4686 RepID=A0A5P1EI64_ASPOF|nr:uncharacterized protein A4U43_C07F37170 [Asparagus officinalis]